MRFQILGPLAASVPLPSAPQPRRLLAVLLARPNEFVSRDTLVDELWPSGAPSSAAAVVQVTVSKLRKTVSPGQPVDGAGQRLRSGPRGYALTLADGELDADEFRVLADAAATAGDRVERRRLFERALACWRGGALADVAGGPLVEAHKLWLEDRRRSVLLQLVELELADGDGAAVVARLEPVLAARPADERVAARLACALGALGRRDAALEVLRRARRAVWDEAGVHPGDELRSVYRRIAGTEWTAGGVPAQLPPDLPDFVGRTAELAALERALRGRAPVVVHGPAGSGKSALAVRAAWRARERFPDGQLVATLRGVTGDPVRVLTGFLRALGAAPAELPADFAGLVATWRGMTADRRLLVLLEDVTAERRIRPLLPAGPGCATVITSRRALPALAGARAFAVPEMSTVDAEELFGAIAGRDRRRAEPAAVAEVLRRCAGLALAVRIAAARLVGRPRLRVAELAARLADERRGLDELVVGDLSVRAAVESALGERTAAERDALARLAAFGGPVQDWCAAALLGRPLPEVRDLLDTLADGHLLSQGPAHRVPGFVRLVLLTGHPRPRLDPVRLRRALDEILARTRGAGPGPDTEQLAAAVRLASRHGWPELTGRLADACAARAETPWLGRSAWAVSVRGLVAARRRGDHRAEAGRLFTLGSVYAQGGRWRQARTYYGMAESRFRALGDREQTGAVLSALADIDVDTGRAEAAADGLREALDLFRDCAAHRRQAVTAAQLGSLLEDLGDVRRAVESFEASLLLARHSGDERALDQVTKRYADVLRRRGHPDRAADLLGEALGGAVRTGQRHWEAHVLRSMGDLHTEAGQWRAGERCLTRSLTLFDHIGHRHAAAYTHRSLAEARRRAGDHAGTRAHLRAAMDVFRDVGDRRGAGYALISLGRSHAETGAAADAQRVLHRAADLFALLGFPLWELRALRELNAVARDSPASARAREVLTRIPS
ncbi:AfsR/SARP family transcriptional regulator [Amycolatopsis samaneae]|uniref:BTAD domain-containing putative transcriptional regulator n=1 Tax=Amycolatopsis samaneae TaxID=664691 RepID=A0ABW5GFI9_9PSEU